MGEGELIIAVVSTIAFFSVPIVWILTAHQRKMAEIIHRNHGNQAATNQDGVSQEVRELRQIVVQQAIAIDNLTNEVKKGIGPLAPPENLSNRLSQ